MATIKVIELIGTSKQSWEDAANNAVKEAQETVSGITGLEVVGQTARVENGVSAELPWRRKIASLNYLLASHVWQQAHNGFTHQDPGFIDHVANKKAAIVRIYLPPEANCLLSVWDHCLRSWHYVNVVIAGKYQAPQWLTMDDAIEHCAQGIGAWSWAGTDRGGWSTIIGYIRTRERMIL